MRTPRQLPLHCCIALSIASSALSSVAVAEDGTHLCLSSPVESTVVTADDAADVPVSPKVKAGTCAPQPRWPRKGLRTLTDYRNVALANFGALTGRVEVEYHRALHPLFGVHVNTYGVAFDSFANENLRGGGILGGARYYLTGRAPEGLWALGAVGFFFRTTRRARDVRLRGFQTDMMIGYTGVWRRFAFSFGGGLQYTRGHLKVGRQSVIVSEWKPRTSLGVGIAF